mmetsp:Transcript_84150/g.272011  ORF Transcript_84150/g.272011 Transcript_84150/m.272011 type:complete len:210 (+) Transcript_84150:445-1074(+)
MAPGCEPNPVWFEWVHAKIVHLKIGIGKNGVEVETFDLVQVLLPGQGPHHRAHKLEVFCQHVAGRACEAAVPCEEALGHDDELRWRDFEGRLRKHGPLIDKVLLGPRLRLPLQLELCQHAALILHSHGCGSGDGAAAAAAAARAAGRKGHHMQSGEEHGGGQSCSGHRGGGKAAPLLVDSSAARQHGAVALRANAREKGALVKNLTATP